jgi:hypothetical protein
MKELVNLAARDRSPVDAKRYAAEARTIIRDLEDLSGKLDLDAPDGMDYRQDVEINAAIVRFLEHANRPATESEITNELIRGQFPGYKDARKTSIRVGRCVRSYTVGKASQNPKLQVRYGFVGLTEWPDKLFKDAKAAG